MGVYDSFGYFRYCRYDSGCRDSGMAVREAGTLKIGKKGNINVYPSSRCSFCYGYQFRLFRIISYGTVVFANDRGKSGKYDVHDGKLFLFHAQHHASVWIAVRDACRRYVSDQIGNSESDAVGQSAQAFLFHPCRDIYYDYAARSRVGRASNCTFANSL